MIEPWAMRAVTKKPGILLASKSPRRKTLLEQSGILFDIVPANVDESYRPPESPEVFVKRVAKNKAFHIAEIHQNRWILSADTVVVIDDKLLGKPDSKAHAEQMLTTLSGNTHLVLTGVCLHHKMNNRTSIISVSTAVTFKPLSPEEMSWYLGSNEPYDKAGAYAIQGIGAMFVEKINGSYTNVVGLPLCEVMTLLKTESILTYEQKQI